MKILLVDRSKIMMAGLTNILSRLKYTDLVLSFSAEEGLEKLQEFEDIRLIIMEWNIPKMGGLSFVEHVRSSPWKETPILMITAAMTRETLHAATLAGVDQYLKKPFTPDQLKEELEIMLQEIP